MGPSPNIFKGKLIFSHALRRVAIPFSSEILPTYIQFFFRSSFIVVGKICVG